MAAEAANIHSMHEVRSNFSHENPYALVAYSKTYYPLVVFSPPDMVSKNFADTRISCQLFFHQQLIK